MPPEPTTRASSARPDHEAGAAHTFLGLARIGLGAVFLWAFLDKLFGFGYATPAARAWINGGTPTKGYLGSSTGPLADLFKSMAGNPVTDALFMLGLLAVGLSLVAGVGVRVAGFAGALMLALMWASHPPWVRIDGAGGPNPLVDSHVIYGLLLLAFAFLHAGRYLGLGGAWEKVPVVRRHHWLE